MSAKIDHDKLGINWFLGAGTVAVLFSFFLFWADNYLTNSQSEALHSKSLKEIRTAQYSLPSHVTDSRQGFASEPDISVPSEAAKNSDAEEQMHEH